MSPFAFPWALVGLLALPALVWLHRRRRRASPVDVPSHLFLEGEPAEAVAPDRVRLDLDLWLGLGALACLALAAAGPRLAGGGTGRVVRLVVETGPSTRATPGGGRSVAAALEEARARVEDAVRARGDRLEVAPAARPGARACVAEAALGAADVRIALCDRLVPDAPAGVHVVAVGDDAGRNVGVVAADVVPDGTGVRVHLVLWNDDRLPARRTLALEAPDGARVERRTLELPPFSAQSVGVPFAAPVPASLAVSAGALAPGEDSRDDLRDDDALVLSRAPLRVGFATPAQGLPAAHRRAVEVALEAILGSGGTIPSAVDLDLFVAPLGVTNAQAALTLFLSPLRDGTPGTRLAPDAPLLPVELPASRDVDPAGCDLVFATPPPSPAPLVRRVPTPRGEGVWFAPDPLAGTPSPVDHAIWPLLLEDLVVARRGRATPSGWRASGGAPLDLEVTRLGRDRAPFDPAWLAQGATVGAVPVRSGRLPLALAGSILALALWLRPGSSRGHRVG